MPRVGDTKTVRLQLRAGPLNDPVHHVLAHGEVPDGEFLQWLERMKFEPLPRALGGLGFYTDGRLLVGSDVVVDAEPSAAPPAEQLLTKKNPALESLEARLATLREQAHAEEARVRRAREDLVELAAHLRSERERVNAELMRLDSDLAAYRKECLESKASYQNELVEVSKASGETLTNVTTAMGGMLATVTAAMQTQMTNVVAVLQNNMGQMASTHTDLLNAESAKAKFVAARQVEAQELAMAQLELLDAMKEAGAKQLLASGAPSPKDKIYEGLGEWIKDDGINKTLNFAERIVDKLTATNKNG